MMANELYRMSFQDRTELEEEIHGVHSLAVTETPELIEESMDKFQRELDATPTESKHAYQEAMTMNITSRHFVQDRKLRLKFLRAELFDAPKAVRRFVLYLDGMKRYFGPSALERPLQYSDMGKAEQDTFKAGVFQILPSRDRAGRLVLVGQGTTTHVSVHTKVREKLHSCYTHMAVVQMHLYVVVSSSHLTKCGRNMTKFPNLVSFFSVSMFSDQSAALHLLGNVRRRGDSKTWPYLRRFRR